MTIVPAELHYTREDEWIRLEGELAVVGITDYAQDALSDIVYLELPAVGDTFAAGDTFGVVESVKAASDLYMPAGGAVVAVNESLVDTPEQINEDPYGAAWLIKVRLSDPGEVEGLMSPADYEAYCAERG